MARLRPQPSVLATVRKLPAPKAVQDAPLPAGAGARVHDDSLLVRRATAVASRRRAAARAGRYQVQFTVSRETHDKLRRAQDLLRHSIPNGDPAAIFDRALTLLVADLERASRPRRAPARGSAGRPRGPATFRRRSKGRCGSVTAASARSSGPRVAVPSEAFSSSITCGRTLTAGDRCREPGAPLPGAQRARGGEVFWPSTATPGARSPADLSTRRRLGPGRVRRQATARAG